METLKTEPNTNETWIEILASIWIADVDFKAGKSQDKRMKI